MHGAGSSRYSSQPLEYTEELHRPGFVPDCYASEFRLNEVLLVLLALALLLLLLLLLGRAAVLDLGPLLQPCTQQSAILQVIIIF